VARDFSVGAPEERTCGDITYVPTQEGWLYLADALDLGSRRVVGFAMAELRPEFDRQQRRPPLPRALRPSEANASASAPTASAAGSAVPTGHDRQGRSGRRFEVTTQPAFDHPQGRAGLGSRICRYSRFLRITRGRR